MSSEKSNEDVIVVFAKSAVPGRVKTRLTPALKEEQAAALYRAFVEDVAATVNEAAASGKARRVLAFAGPEDDEICRVLAGQGFEVMDQGDGDLGRRLERICESVAAGGARRVVIIGTDSPTLHAEHLGLAFDLLGRHDVVWGPSSDGGYYLVGLNVGDGDTAPHRHIFQNIDWST
ncbi:MAG: TIGR04282 family arsenosugar biosynthesis glycosyltransferase, partial [Bradymonadaceae bacterium]